MKNNETRQSQPWEKDLDSFKGIKHFIIEGNVSDFYLSSSSGRLTLGEKIEEIYHSGGTDNHYDFVMCDPIFGFYSNELQSDEIDEIVKRSNEIYRKNEKRIASWTRENTSAKSEDKFIWTSNVIRTLLTEYCGVNQTSRKSIGIIVNYASNFLTSPDNYSENETQFFTNIRYGIDHAISGNTFVNTIILIANNLHDLPSWFISNPNIRSIIIPKPSREIRERYIDASFDIFSDTEGEEAKKKLIDLTDRLTLKEIDEIRRLIIQKQLNASQIGDAIKIYKYGFSENQWDQVRRKLESVDIEEALGKTVFGQKEALKKVADVLKCAVTGLSSVGSSSGSNRPRGVLFLDGPSGTGKTETVKAASELLFEDQGAIQRFDMSEYSDQHSDQKLFGAPPGYVGYNEGGQLTNAIKKNPFCILLFDEIEKAHPSIMEKFLQVLEDGRLTDGQGNTVNFSETLIFFTSNAGMQRRIKDSVTNEEKLVNLVNPNEDHSVIEKKVKNELKNIFKQEVLNRIGDDNIVVFNFIDKESSEYIVKSKIDLINKQIFEMHNVNISVTELALKEYCELCMKEDIRSNGGRGIKMLLEREYVKLIANYLYKNQLVEGESVTVDFNNGNFVLS